MAPSKRARELLKCDSVLAKADALLSRLTLDESVLDVRLTSVSGVLARVRQRLEQADHLLEQGTLATAGAT